jgi:hypothetical protein
MKKIIFLSLAIIIALSGCESLDETPQSSLSPSNFYRTTGEVESAFAASMNDLWFYWGTYGNGYGAGNFFAEDDHNITGVLDINSYTGNEIWGSHYKAIANLNMALNAVLNGTTIGTEAELDLLEGQARFLRAYNYFMLVRLYGKLPLYTEDDNPIDKPEARSSIDEVYGLIVNDLIIAASKLPTSWPETQKGRPANTAAKGLLAKVYLTMATAPLNRTENFALAAASALEVMNTGIELISDVNAVFAMENRYRPEWMWGFNSTFDDRSTPVDIYAPGEDPWYGWEDIMSTDTFALYYPDQPRKYAYLQCYNGNGEYYTDWVESWTKTPGIKKYLYSDIEDIWAYHTWYNFPILRYADVLLIYAEAANMANNGPTQTAVDAINQVIDRANGNQNGNPEARATTSSTMLEFNDKVLLERSYELCWEYDRWFDLLRTRTLKAALEASKPLAAPNFDDKFYLLPVPFVDLRLNPLLQPNNPGWPDNE